MDSWLFIYGNPSMFHGPHMLHRAGSGEHANQISILIRTVRHITICLLNGSVGYQGSIDNQQISADLHTLAHTVTSPPPQSRIWIRKQKEYCGTALSGYLFSSKCSLATLWHRSNLGPVPGMLAFKPKFSNLRRTVDICTSECLELISCLLRRYVTIRQHAEFKREKNRSSIAVVFLSRLT